MHDCEAKVDWKGKTNFGLRSTATRVKLYKEDSGTGAIYSKIQEEKSVVFAEDSGEGASWYIFGAVEDRWQN